MEPIGYFVEIEKSCTLICMVAEHEVRVRKTFVGLRFSITDVCVLPLSLDETRPQIDYRVL